MKKINWLNLLVWGGIGVISITLAYVFFSFIF